MSRVYKYLDTDRLGFLSDGLIRFTPPGALNDPYECLPSISEELEALAIAEIKTQHFRNYEPLPTDSRAHRRLKLKSATKLWEQKQKTLISNQAKFSGNFLENALGKMNSALGILSVSTRWDSALMWSHYTNSYSGFCVGFHRDHDFFSGQNAHQRPNFPLSPVEYSVRRLVMSARRLNPEESIRLLLTKSVNWEYEKEERKVAFLNQADDTIDSQPFKISLFKVPFDAIAELIIGNRASPQVKQQVQEAAKRLNVPCYETRVSRNSFDVERALLPVLS
ncbi:MULTISPECIES: DUF2971 domain-containing protein [unclassified Pseudomonas]|uniref:DUF2971 domain-containing protein n=1 Tax=unclassified Pseudomonas TaxID=196821 RepID=UPI001CBE7739|nr:MULTISPECIES: DUF2971 domain-containing protein [unclassified Pseudomonas]